jgi:ribulose-phosphate 3-epimerase
MPHFKKILDVHVMTVDPLKYLDFFAELNSEYYTFHYEAVKNINEVIDEIKMRGLKVGLAINPETKVSLIEGYLSELDQILVMSCQTGIGGTAEFKINALEKISYLKKLRDSNNYKYIINVDGVINSETIALVKEAGVDMVVSGSYICLADNMEENIGNLRMM